MVAEIAGTWIPIRSQWNGEPTAEEDLSDVTLTFVDNRCEVHRAGLLIRHGTCSVNAAETPGEIDVCFVESDVPELIDAPLHGIFELNGDELRICYGMPGGKRAKSFSAEHGTEQYFGEYRRAPHGFPE